MNDDSSSCDPNDAESEHFERIRAVVTRPDFDPAILVRLGLKKTHKPKRKKAKTSKSEAQAKNRDILQPNKWQVHARRCQANLSFLHAMHISYCWCCCMSGLYLTPLSPLTFLN
jgi:hypothetical protein